MKKILVCVLVLMFVLGTGVVLSDAEDFTEAKKLIDAKTPCSKLAENQLEAIGDYLMEQMHPGEAHEAMDRMMGGEGSESLRLMHIAMAKRIYCNYINSSVKYGFDGMMGINRAGMMNLQYDNYGEKSKGAYGGMMQMMNAGMFGYGMMGNYGYFGFYSFLTSVLLIGMIILVYLWIVKLWKEIFRKTK